MLASIFKAYDIRGIYPEEINEELIYKIAQAYLKFTKSLGPIAVGMDVRTHSPSLKASLIKGLLDGGADVIDIGFVSTEMLYFAVGYYNLKGGLQVTASHNPAEYNGLKMVKEGVVPISSDSGIFEIRDLALNNQWKIENKKKGTLKEKNVLDDFINFAFTFIDENKIKPLKLAYNPNFGFQGIVLERIKEIKNLPLSIIGLNHIPDGSFPKGKPDPLENQSEFSEFTKNANVDLGIAWDADGDRICFFTKNGLFVEPYWINVILSKYILEKNKGEKIIYDPRYSWALLDAIKLTGGISIQEKAGHSFIKEAMRREDAIFASETSGHYYFKNFWYADSGIIPLLMMLEIVSTETELEKLIEPLINNYFISGELNFKIKNSLSKLKEIEKIFSNNSISKMDGLTIESENWRVNIRESNTEPLLRVNVEGKSKDIVEQKVKELTEILKDSL